ncbi:MAG: S-layer homology domain-containing protein [Firmicutes bacterium]|nr:S-layer homology domain-containing protein [Bacillota bacterium]
MKKAKLIKLFIIIIVLYLVFSIQVHAEVPANLESMCSKALVNLKIMIGDENGNLNLQNKVTRCEFITLVNRMMTYDYDEKIDDSVIVPFKDISQKHWAYNNIKIALKYALIKGYTDNTVRPDNYVSLVEAKAVILRALGYENTINKKWPEGIAEKAKELGLDKNLKVPNDKLITRGEASILIYNALTVNFVE